jgi:hypothetical protein
MHKKRSLNLSLEIRMIHGKRPINHQKHHQLQNRTSLTFLVYSRMRLSLFDRVLLQRETTT